MTDSWVQLANGAALRFDAESDMDGFTVEDLARQLANLARFRGAADWAGPPINVAQHSVHVALIVLSRCGPRVALWAILHDAHEIAISDIPSPVKRRLKEKCAGFAGELAALERAADSAILKALELNILVPLNEAEKAEIRRADLVALKAEYLASMAERHPWGSVADVPLWAYKISPQAPKQSALEFVRFYKFLRAWAAV